MTDAGLMIVIAVWVLALVILATGFAMLLVLRHYARQEQAAYLAAQRRRAEIEAEGNDLEAAARTTPRRLESWEVGG